MNYSKILNDEFNPAIRARGKSIFKNGGILSVEYNNLHRTITSKVQGSLAYDQTIIISPGGTSTVLSKCSCPYRFFCKHQAAVLYYLSESQDAPYIDDSNQFDSKSSIKRGFDEPKDLSKPILINSFAGNISKIIAHFSKKLRSEFQYAHNANVHFNAPGKFEVKIIKTSYNTNNGYLEAQVNIAYANKNEISISCSQCDEKSIYLCHHQSFALHEISKYNLYPYLTEPDDSYHRFVQKKAEEVGMSTKAFINYFSLDVKNGRKQFVPKDRRILSQNNYYDLEKSLTKKRKQLIVQHTNLRVRESKATVALLWEKETNQFVSLIKGKTRKKDGVLNAGIKETTDALQLPAKIQPIFSQLHEWQSQNNHQVSEGYYTQKAFELLKNNIQSFGLHPQYYYNSLSEYEQSRKIKNYNHFYFKEHVFDIKVFAKKEDELYVLEFMFSIDDAPILNSKVNFITNLFIVIKDEAFLPKKLSALTLLKNLKEERIHKYLPVYKQNFLANLIALKTDFDVSIDKSIDLKIKEISTLKKSIYLTQEEDAIFFEPRLINDSVSFDLLKESVIYQDETFLEIPKDDYELFLEQLVSLHPDFKVQMEFSELLFLSTQDFLKDQWFFNFYEKCQESDIDIYGQDNLKNLNFNKNKAQISSSVKSGIDWFDVEVSITFGDQEVSTKSWIKAIKENQKYIKLGDGSLGLIPDEWFQKLKNINDNSEWVNDELKISKYNFNLIDQLFEEITDEMTVMQIAQKREQIIKIKDFNGQSNVDLPVSINANLRPYQNQGFNWLKFLQTAQFGGILADDMGLGKTLQIICILADQVVKSVLPNLVVVPRSLLFNWANEIDKFCPSLRYFVHHGPNRDKENKDKILSYDVIISTYSTVAMDIVLFKSIDFGYIVLDESQAIKNPNSKRFKAMRLLQGEHRLAMTGTPIENNTFDLYAQMSFVNPGWLGSSQNFKDKFATPIDSNGDQDAANMLQQMIQPFLLRRTKEQVASDLPDKTESVIYCEMGSHQRRLYNELRDTIRHDVYEMIESTGLQKSRFKILEGLLRLRQMCNSPEILDASAKNASAKIQEIESLLQDELKGKNVLIFSQFVTMLQLLKDSLEKQSIKYAYLDGSTRDREQAVSDFMDDETCQVFLLSLKAGNTGLNLTKADYVFIVDPWWNPAVEAQAIDRTHRIGQDKHVFAYRLICKDSIEEKIMKLKMKKQKLASDIIKVDDQVFKSMDKDQILHLFD